MGGKCQGNRVGAGMRSVGEQEGWGEGTWHSAPTGPPHSASCKGGRTLGLSCGLAQPGHHGESLPPSAHRTEDSSFGVCSGSLLPLLKIIPESQ